MDINTNGYQAYKKTQIQTADQGKLILMCYDGAISFLMQARKAHEENKYQVRDNFFTKAQNIIWELDNSLNFEAGEIAYNLDSLYNYMIRRIIDSQYHNNDEAAKEVVHHLQELKEAWETIILKK
jgi:flagellar secretion chaperone FliS